MGLLEAPFGVDCLRVIDAYLPVVCAGRGALNPTRLYAQPSKCGALARP